MENSRILIKNIRIIYWANERVSKMFPGDLRLNHRMQSHFSNPLSESDYWNLIDIVSKAQKIRKKLFRKLEDKVKTCNLNLIKENDKELVPRDVTRAYKKYMNTYIKYQMQGIFEKIDVAEFSYNENH